MKVAATSSLTTTCAVLGALAATLAGCGSPSSSPQPAATPPAAQLSGSSAAQPPNPAAATPIRITFGENVLHAQVWDNPAGRSLIAQLPLTVQFSDLNHEEKVGHLDTPLSMDGMPDGDDPQPQDLGWYAPWGNLVFYYGDVGYWSGIARIGRFTDNVAPIAAQNQDFTAVIERDR